MRDHGDEYDAIESELNHFIGPKLLTLTVVGYLSLILINELLWGIITAIGFVFLTGFFIARFILNVQGRLNLAIVSVLIGSNILAFCWFIHKIL
ncbi:MAG: hypothetical protein WCH39_14160 [Schlesneria sp.]